MTGLAAATRRVLLLAIDAHRHDPATAQRLHAQLRRLDEPLRVAIAGKVKAGKSTLLNALVGLRGGYSSMAMFGMFGTLIGFASAANPIGIGAAIFMSGKAIGDERKKQATRRQNEAKAAMRRYVDDVTFQVAKDSRDRLRAVQRDLRDHFTTQADQLKRSLLEAQQATERAQKASRAEREARLAEIAKELEQLELVRRQAQALLQKPAAAASAAPAGRSA